MAFRLHLPESWTEVDLHVDADGVGFAAVRTGTDPAAQRLQLSAASTPPSLAATEGRYATDIPMLRLMQRATGRAAAGAGWVQVVDDRVLIPDSVDSPMIRTVRVQRRGSVEEVLQYLVLAAGPVSDGGRDVVHLVATVPGGAASSGGSESTGGAGSIASSTAELIAAELEPIIGSLTVVAGPPGRLR